jgi:Fic family protein
MDKYKISKGEPRPIINLGFGIAKYNDIFLERWNAFLDKYTLKYDSQELKLLADSVLHLEDMIIHTNAAHRAEVEELKAELRKWTENRGRKPLLTKEQHEQIKLLRADGESCRKLARKFGVSERTVRRVLESECTYTPQEVVQCESPKTCP